MRIKNKLSERKTPETVRAYWADLRLIRESKKITLDGIHRGTKIPIAVLRDFERDGLKSNRHFNRVYRISLVTAYASEVGVERELVRTAVTSSAAGSYDGVLAREYLSRVPAAHGS